MMIVRNLKAETRKPEHFGQGDEVWTDYGGTRPLQFIGFARAPNAPIHVQCDLLCDEDGVAALERCFMERRADLPMPEPTEFATPIEMAEEIRRLRLCLAVADKMLAGKKP